MRLFLFLVFLLGVSLSFGQATAWSGYTESDNITYTSALGPPRQLDLFQPKPFAVGQTFPGIIFVHGGGWIGGEKEDFDPWCQYYATLGYVCISINYRMLPKSWPVEIDDTQAAVRWMRKNATWLHLNPNKIGAVGASAGGHLVLFLGETDTLHDFDPTLSGYSSKVQAVADFYGPTNFIDQYEWTPSIWSLIEELNGFFYLVPTKEINTGPFAISAPMTYCTPYDSPTVIFHGTADPIVPVDQSQEITKLKQSLGAPVTYYEFPGEGHGFNGPDTYTCLLIINSYFGAILKP